MCGFAWLSLSYVHMTLPAFVRCLMLLTDVDGFCNRVGMGGLRSEYYSDTPRRHILQELQSILVGKFAVSKIALYVRTLVSI